MRYGTAEAADLVGRWMALIERAAYRASARDCRREGRVPALRRGILLWRGALSSASLPRPSALIAAHGIRNGLLTSIAPTGTISLFAGNVSSGIEPVFAFTYTRKMLTARRHGTEEAVEDHAYRQFRAKFGADAALPDPISFNAGAWRRAIICGAGGSYSDTSTASISKTMNCPADISFAAFKDLYRDAYAMGCKGCTTYRPNAVTGSVLQPPLSQSLRRSTRPYRNKARMRHLPLSNAPMARRARPTWSI